MSTSKDNSPKDNTPKDSTPEDNTPEATASDTTTPEVATPVNDRPDTNVRAARKAQREAERAARAQRKADAARERAMEAARAGGLFAGMESAPGAAGRSQASAEQTIPSQGDEVPTSSPTSTQPTRTQSASAQPASTPPATATTTRAGEPMDPARQRTLIRILAALSVVFLVIAGLATWQYFEAREATAVEEQIANAPTSATDAAREIATQMFTYDHRTVDADLAAVRDKLTEPALGEFVKESMPAVTSAAQQQEATVYATVAAAAPQEVVDEDNVTVLVMLNRMVSTKDAPEAASSASRLSMRMERDGDTWKLAKLDAL